MCNSEISSFSFFLFSDSHVSRKCLVRQTGSSMTDEVQHALARAEQCSHAAFSGGTYSWTSVRCQLPVFRNQQFLFIC